MEAHALSKCIPWSRSKNASRKRILIINLNHYQMDLSMCIPLSPWQNRREILNRTNGTEFQDWLYPIRTASKLLRSGNSADIWWVMRPNCHSIMCSSVAKRQLFWHADNFAFATYWQKFRSQNASNCEISLFLSQV